MRRIFHLHPRTCRRSTDQSNRLAANVKEHPTSVWSSRLEAQPVPAGLAGFELMREEFMVIQLMPPTSNFSLPELE